MTKWSHERPVREKFRRCESCDSPCGPRSSQFASRAAPARSPPRASRVFARPRRLARVPNAGPVPNPGRPRLSRVSDSPLCRRRSARVIRFRPDARHRRQPQGAQVLVGAPRQRHARGHVENPVAAHHLARVQRRRLASRLSTRPAPGAPGLRGRRPARTPRVGRGRTGAALGPGGGRGGSLRRVRLRGWR